MHVTAMNHRNMRHPAEIEQPCLFKAAMVATAPAKAVCGMIQQAEKTCFR